MVRPIMKDEFFLGQVSKPATVEDVSIATDLLETLKAHHGECVGMAGNMIGFSKCIIAVCDEGDYLLMCNPKILKQSKPFETEEGCLSLQGTRPVKRFQSIKVQWETIDFEKRIKTFQGWTAQIIQHEIDHCNGIVI